MRAALLALFAVPLVTGCWTSLDDREAPKSCTDKTVPVCEEAADHSDFAWIQQNIFSSNCSGDDCHGIQGSKPLGGRFSLGAGAAYESLLGSATCTGMDCPLVATEIEHPDRKLVQPGRPDQSYLLFIMKGISAAEGAPPFEKPPLNIGFMPQKNETLCCQKLDAIQRWIAAGAQP